MHDIHINAHDKASQYAQLLPQIRALIADDGDLPMAVLGNVCAVLKSQFHWFWVGFYLVDKSQTFLHLAPFQGSVACTRIAKGRGVCGQAWAQNQTIIVPDVNLHPDHIACSPLSQSEIVLPLHNRCGEVMGVLDIDHSQRDTFDETDAHYLRQIVDMVGEILYSE